MYILVGDDGQIGPVHDTRLQSQIDLNDKNVCRKALGKRIYETFTDVVILRDNPRCVEHERQRDLLLRLQNLEHTQEDFKILQGHCRSNLSIEEIATFNEAILLTKTNSRKNEKNLQKASELRNENGNPLVRIPSVCSTTYAKVAPDEEAEGLKKELFLIEDMRIMVTANYWIDAGVCNGSTGELIYIYIYIYIYLNCANKDDVFSRHPPPPPPISYNFSKRNLYTQFFFKKTSHKTVSFICSHL